MEYVLAAVLVIAFFMCISAYALGLSHGKQLSEGRVPKVDLNPVRAVTKAVERHEKKQEEKKADNDLNEIMSYNLNTALSAIKKENHRL